MIRAYLTAAKTLILPKNTFYFYCNKYIFLFKDISDCNKRFFSRKDVRLQRTNYSFPKTYCIIQWRKHCSFLRTYAAMITFLPKTDYAAAKTSFLPKRKSCSNETIYYFTNTNHTAMKALIVSLGHRSATRGSGAACGSFAVLWSKWVWNDTQIKTLTTGEDLFFFFFWKILMTYAP